MFWFKVVLVQSFFGSYVALIVSYRIMEMINQRIEKRWKGIKKEETGVRRRKSNTWSGMSSGLSRSKTCCSSNDALSELQIFYLQFNCDTVLKEYFEKFFPLFYLAGCV